jgi:hypothetical protein
LKLTTKQLITKMSNKFCKMCFDAGKVEVNHFLRDRQGVVTCPTLKGIKCRFCSGVGHTPKYCPVLKSKTEKEIRAQQFQKAKEEVVKKEVAKKDAPVNIFDMLNDDDDEVEEGEIVEEEQEGVTYADMLNNGVVPLEIPKLVRNSPQPIKKTPAVVKRTSWYEDSSDEESVYDGDL